MTPTSTFTMILFAMAQLFLQICICDFWHYFPIKKSVYRIAASAVFSYTTYFCFKTQLQCKIKEGNV